MERIDELGLDGLIAERRRGRHAGARHLPRLPAAVRVVDRARRAPTGLGLIEGAVEGLDAPGLKVPHIGWEPVEWATRLASSPRGSPTGRRSTSSTASRRARRSEADVLGRPTHGERFACAIARPPIYGVQFHPEKSSARGAARCSRTSPRICARSRRLRDPLSRDRHPRRPRGAARPGRLRPRDRVRRRPARRGAALGRAGGPRAARRRPRRRAGRRAGQHRARRADLRRGRRPGPGRRRAARGRATSRRCSTPAPRGRSSAPRRSPTRRWSSRWPPTTARRSSSPPTRAPAGSRSRAGSARPRLGSAELVADLARRGVRTLRLHPGRGRRHARGAWPRRSCGRSPRRPRRAGAELIYSGGIGTLDHLRELAAPRLPARRRRDRRAARSTRGGSRSPRARPRSRKRIGSRTVKLPPLLNEHPRSAADLPGDHPPAAYGARDRATSSASRRAPTWCSRSSGSSAGSAPASTTSGRRRGRCAACSPG